MSTSRGRLEDLTALVTGGSRGIGLAIAKALLADGARVCIAATDVDTLQRARNTLADFEDRIEIAVLDVADRNSCLAEVQRIQAQWQRLDILVNSAGIYKPSRFLDYQNGDFQRLLDVNLFGVINLMQAVLPGMIERRYGRVINVASTAGKWGSVNQSAYNVSKHAVVGLTRCVALETATSGATVNAICPGFVQTDLVDTFWNEHAAITGLAPDVVRDRALARQPIGRLLEPAEIGALAAFLASPAAGGLTGQSILHDGGMLLV